MNHVNTAWADATLWDYMYMYCKKNVFLYLFLNLGITWDMNNWLQPEWLIDWLIDW
jgi:hypothetical protein